MTLQLNPLLFRCLFRRQQRQFHPPQIRFSLLHHLRFGGDFDLQLGRRLINQIDRLVRQATVADVAIRQPIGGLNRLIGDRDAVMQLVALPQAAQDLQAELEVRLANQHLLKAPVKGGILFHRPPVFLRRRRTDATQIPPRQGGFEQAARIGAAAVTAHHGVELVDEQHHPGIRATHLLQHGAQAFLELTAEFGPGDQGTEIKGNQSQPLQGIRYLSSHNPLGQELGDGRLADAGFSDQHRVVFAAAGEHLDQVADLAVATDHRIERPRFSLLSQIPAIGFKR